MVNKTETEKHSLHLAGEETFPAFVRLATARKTLSLPYAGFKAFVWAVEGSAETLKLESHGPSVTLIGSGLGLIRDALEENKARIVEEVGDKFAALVPAGEACVTKIRFEAEEAEGGEAPARGSMPEDQGDEGLDG